jgi:hypothetical protein
VSVPVGVEFDAEHGLSRRETRALVGLCRGTTDSERGDHGGSGE